MRVALRVLALIVLMVWASALRSSLRYAGCRCRSALHSSLPRNYGSYSRQELQSIAKSRGIRANLASAEIIRQLGSSTLREDTPTPSSASPASSTPSTQAPTLGPRTYARGQSIQVRIIKFGPLGASVSVDNDTEGDAEGEESSRAYGLVLQREIALFRERRGSDVIIGETIPAFVEKVREDGRLNVSLRPIDAPRIRDTAEQVLEALEGSPSLKIPIGDKSSPQDISSYFYGVTKSDFKKAVGSLFKQGIARPGPFETELIPEEEREEALAQIGKAKVTTVGEIKAVRAAPSASSSSSSSSSSAVVSSFESAEAAPQYKEKSQQDGNNLKSSLNQQRGDIRRTIFLGNLPISITADAVFKAVCASSVLSPGQIQPPIRIPLDEAGKPRGFAYIELTREEDVAAAVVGLKGIVVGGRTIRSDFADPEAKKIKAVDAGRGETVRDLLRKPDLSEQRPSTSDAPLWKRKDPNAPPPVEGPAAAATLYLGNLSYKAGVEEITRFLEARAGKGSVRAVRVASDEATGRKKGFAFVDFYRENDAKQCFDELHDVDFLGRNVQIDDATRR